MSVHLHHQHLQQGYGKHNISSPSSATLQKTLSSQSLTTNKDDKINPHRNSPHRIPLFKSEESFTSTSSTSFKSYASKNGNSGDDSDDDEDFDDCKLIEIVVSDNSCNEKDKNNNSKNLALNDFNLGATLGVGSFGRVKFCTFVGKDANARKRMQSLDDQMLKDQDFIPPMAIKMMKKTEIVKLNQVDHIMAEKEILNDINSGSKRPIHPFIVRYFGAFQDCKYLYMVLEFVNGGEFFTHLRTLGCFDEYVSRFYSASVVSIFEYLHEDKIIYRDLKPENLLLNYKGFLKLTDFGFAKRVQYKTYTLCGTPEYIAPEVLLNQGHGKEVDWWTLGIFTYEMLVGKPPFMHDQPMEIYKMVLSGHVEYPKKLSSSSKSYIRHLLDLDLGRRYGCGDKGAYEVKQHRWMNGLDFAALFNLKLVPPLLPTTDGPNDTGNFEEYRDSIDGAQEYIRDINKGDPFVGF